ncbi:cyclodeaminase [Halobacillus kuroshimensis]|uniref:Cyclodeaminase n=1 Tax=Halobacillus kuroshimensis TaxID=302481 RepID=A0ABS3DY46_9BACI|nr:cyclodeaminase [Halobacillus kuroshimensis]
MQLYTREEIERLIRLDPPLIKVIEQAFTALVTKKVTMPPIMRMDVPEHNGEVDIKSAYIEGEDSFAVKLSSGFFNNPSVGLPTSGGMMILLDSRTGQPLAVLADDGLLTDLRTAAAGAVAAAFCSRKVAGKAGIIGTGAQARLQLKALTLVRPIDHVYVYGRRKDQAAIYKKEVENEQGLPVTICSSVKQVVDESDIVVTTTPSREPLIYAEWLKPGLHITAMGSDAEHKQELDHGVLEKADSITCDVIHQSRRLGELRGVPDLENRALELGELTSGRKQARTSDEDITICDLTGTGVQDTAIARFAWKALKNKGDDLRERS